MIKIYNDDQKEPDKIGIIDNNDNNNNNGKKYQGLFDTTSDEDSLNYNHKNKSKN